MKSTEEMSFGEYIQALRLADDRSLRQTAMAIGITPQFYSDVEKRNRSGFTPERLAKLKVYLHMTQEQAEIMYDKAAEARRSRDITVPQDFSGYIVNRDYVIAALRTAQTLDADQNDWQKFVNDLISRKNALEGK
jgi:transcriptional regulator with XRE-family HTH domain